MHTPLNTHFDQRENNFDVIRIALALMVIFSHSYLLCTGSELGDPFKVLTLGQATGGHIAVDLFFIISGFLITASFERSSTVLNYLGKRIRRIYPAFIVLSILSAVVVLPIAGGHLARSSFAGHAGNVLTHALRLRGLDASEGFAGNPYPAVMNASLWSVSYEFYCYLGVILLGFCGLLRSRRWLLVLLTLAVGVSVAFVIHAWNPSGGMAGTVLGTPLRWARLSPMFLAGILLYRLRGHLRLTKTWIGIALGLMVVAARIPHLWMVLFPLVGGYLILAVAFHPALRLHRWSRFGDFSYGTYLYAFPIQQLILQWIGHTIAPVQLFLLAVPPTLLCAAISWHGVEKWFLLPRTRPEASLEPTSLEPAESDRSPDLKRGRPAPIYP